MTAHTPRIPLLFDNWCRLRKGIPALRAEEVTAVEVGAAGEDDFAFDGGLAGFAAGGEGFVVV